MSRLSRIVPFLSCVIVLSNLMGCSTFNPHLAKKMPKATAADPVVEIVCLWQPGEGTDPEGVPCKGFTGLILFLARSSSTPVQIEGEVRVYLFDDQGTQEEQAKPLRQFNFDNGSWAIHLADSPFGPAYHVFIPYVRRGVTSADCSLRVRLKPKQGPTVFSDFSNMPLNGHKKALRGDEAKPITQDEVDRLAAEAMSNDLRRTTTISLGPNSKTTETSPISKSDTNASQIQLAAHEDAGSPHKDSAEADQIRRLEAMVQKLKEQQGNSAMAPASSIPTDQREKQLDTEPSASIIPGERLKMSRRMRLQMDNETEANRIPRRRRSHPLDDEQPEKSTSKSASENQLAQEPEIGDPFSSTADASPRFSLQDQRYQRMPR